MNKLSLVLVLLFSFFTFSEARNVTFEGKNFMLTLPDGYCDQTDKALGKVYLKFIENRLSNMSGPQMTPIFCLLYTSPSPRDQRGSRMPSSA